MSIPWFAIRSARVFDTERCVKDIVHVNANTRRTLSGVLVTVDTGCAVNSALGNANTRSRLGNAIVNANTKGSLGSVHGSDMAK